MTLRYDHRVILNNKFTPLTPSKNVGPKDLNCFRSYLTSCCSTNGSLTRSFVSRNCSRALKSCELLYPAEKRALSCRPPPCNSHAISTTDSNVPKPPSLSLEPSPRCLSHIVVIIEASVNCSNLACALYRNLWKAVVQMLDFRVAL